MKAEISATGILKRHEWGDAKYYQIVCECGDSDHDHNVCIEAEDTGISIIIYTKNTTPFWSKRRWRQMWELLVRGYVKQEVAICMNEQQALNYAETLKAAIEDVKGFRKK